jgi:hypothetical protein
MLLEGERLFLPKGALGAATMRYFDRGKKHFIPNAIALPPFLTTSSFFVLLLLL